MKILFVRHAEAEPLKDGVEDAKRTLTSRGHDELMRRVADIRAYFSMQGRVRLWASDYVRSVETARYLEQGLDGVEMETYKFLRKNKYDKLLDRLQKVEEDAVLVVGHSPMLEEWIEALSGESVTLDTMEAICVNFQGDHAAVLWDWTKAGEVRVRPYAKEMGITVQSWLEDCAFALHSDIILSRYLFQEGALEQLNDQETEWMLSFLSVIEPLLPQKNFHKATERYMLSGSQSFELYWISELCRDIEEQMGPEAVLLGTLDRIYQDELRVLQKQILSFEAQKTYHKAYRSVVKGLRAFAATQELNGTKALYRFFEKSRDRFAQDCRKELELVNLTDEKAVLALEKKWKTLQAEERFRERFLSTWACSVPSLCFPLTGLAHQYHLLSRLRYNDKARRLSKDPETAPAYEQYRKSLQRRIHETVAHFEERRAKGELWAEKQNEGIQDKAK